MTRLPVVFFLLAIAVVATAAPDAADAAVAVDPSDVAVEESTADPDTSAYAEKLPSNYGWEKALALPGKIVYIPFWLAFKTAEGAIWYYERKPPLPKWMQLFFSADGSRGLYPMFEPRYGAGFLFYRKNWPGDGSRFDVSTMFGLNWRQRHRLRHRRIGVFDNYAKLGYRLRYHNLPDERFFGVGINSKEEDETNYRHQMALGEVTLGKRYRDRLQVDIIGALEHNTIGDGVADVPQIDPAVPGVAEELTMVRFGFGLDFDGLNQNFRPSKGSELALRGGWIQDANDTDYGFSIAAADLRAYVQPYRGRVLVLRVAGEFTDPLPGRETPFYWLPQLGRLETIRGLTRNRYRDNDMVLASIEYRWEVSRWGDALLFFDTGQVAANIFNDFKIQRFVWSVGGGYRIWLPDGRTGLRAELGVSDERVRFHFVING